MELRFSPDTHSYVSINDPDKKWTSVTTLLKYFKEPFDALKIAEKCSKSKKGKWSGIPSATIVDLWNKETERACALGNWYHDQREQEVLSCDTIQREGLDLPIFGPIKDGVNRLSPDQQLVAGIYPEHFMYLKSAGICGQADRIEVVGDRVDVYDYKSNKKIDKVSYVDWQGSSKKMQSPLEHLDDCNLNHYTLQLSIYMYIILKHNHNLKPGKLTIQHVTFESESFDEFDFPITALDSDGNPIIKEVISYEVPYLKSEVASLFNHIKLNPNILTHD